MAILEQPHWESITLQMREVMLLVGRQPFSRRFYLAGGTALSLRLGHRRSVDLDFFSEKDEVGRKTRDEIVHGLTDQAVEVVEASDGNLLLRISGLHVGFFSYGYRLVGSLEQAETVSVAALPDLALMKLDALIGRGSRKDFIDLYFAAREIPLPEILDLGLQKYPQVRDFALMATESLVLFENAERDIPPEMLVETSWEAVKLFFLDQARQIGKTWLAQ